MTEIAKYNGMMSYLTRPPKPKMQVADLVDDLEPGSLKDELTKDYDPSQEEYEEYLRRKSLERPFNASNGGSPTVPKPKPAEDPLEVFKKKSDLFLQGSFGSSDKTFFNNLIEQEYDKALDAGVLPEEAISFLRLRKSLEYMLIFASSG